MSNGHWPGEALDARFERARAIGESERSERVRLSGRMADVLQAADALIDNATGPHENADGLHVRVRPGDLTILSRVVRDGCTYEEALNG